MKKLTKIFTAVALFSATQAAFAAQHPFSYRDIGKIVDCKTQECQPLEQIYINLKFEKKSHSRGYFGFIPKLTVELVGNHKEFGPYDLKMGEQYIYRKDRRVNFETGLNYQLLPVTATFENGKYVYDNKNAIPEAKFLQVNEIRKKIINYFMTSPGFSSYRDLAMLLAHKNQQDYSVRVDLRQVPVKNKPSENYWAGYLALWDDKNNIRDDHLAGHVLTFDGGIMNGINYMRADIPLTGGYHGDTFYGRKDSQGNQRFAEFITKETDFGDFLSFMHSKI
ncbi:MAG: hypothetical protein ACPGUD_11435 [Parashewanella sp.]